MEVAIVLVAALMRIIPHLPNVAPIGALALFGGTYFSKKKALIIPLLALIISDYFIGFHALWMWVYGSFLLTVLIGFLIKKASFKNIFLASTASSILFFIITNFGVWVQGTMYPKTLAGLTQCYIMALPFFRNTLVGDWGYNLVFFGGYALVPLFFPGKIKESPSNSHNPGSNIEQ